MASSRQALLIVRAWVERGSSAPLRASIRLTTDLSNGIEQTTTVTSPEAAAEVVRGFLKGVLEADTREANRDQATRPVEADERAATVEQFGSWDLQRVHVENLIPSSSESAVRELFAPHGIVSSYHRPVDPVTQGPANYAFVEMTHADAAKAISALNGQQFAGQMLRVSATKHGG